MSTPTIIPTLTPAYGRDYSSMKTAIKDLKCFRDFILHDFTSKYDGKPCNLTDLRAAGYSQIKIRYNKKRAVAHYNIKESK